MAFPAFPPSLNAGMICDLIGAKAFIFLLVPFSGNSRTERLKRVFLAYFLSHAVWAASNSAAAHADIHLPAVSSVTPPPNTLSGFDRYIMRREGTVFNHIPFPCQVWTEGCQRIIFACQTTIAIGAPPRVDFISYFSSPFMPTPALPPNGF